MNASVGPVLLKRPPLQRPLAFAAASAVGGLSQSRREAPGGEGSMVRINDIYYVFFQSLADTCVFKILLLGAFLLRSYDPTWACQEALAPPPGDSSCAQASGGIFVFVLLRDLCCTFSSTLLYFSFIPSNLADLCCCTLEP